MTNSLASKCLACARPIPPRMGKLQKIGRRTLCLGRCCDRKEIA